MAETNDAEIENRNQAENGGSFSSSISLIPAPADARYSLTGSDNTNGTQPNEIQETTNTVETADVVPSGSAYRRVTRSRQDQLHYENYIRNPEAGFNYTEPDYENLQLTNTEIESSESDSDCSSKMSFTECSDDEDEFNKNNMKYSSEPTYGDVVNVIDS